jgi:TAT (twin-arginine translocation) pathway signal sequence
MIVSRRSLLKTGAAASAAIALPAMTASRPRRLTLFDRRIPESNAFARTIWENGGVVIDLADSDATLWAQLREDFPGMQRIVGLTGWSDWVIARGFVEERGFRLISQTSVPAPVSGKAHLFRFEMRRLIPAER